MKYTRINNTHIAYLSEKIGIDKILTGSDCDIYASDHTEDLSCSPEIVVLPQSVNDVSNILQYANTNNIPVTPSASLTGLSGGAIPVYGGICMSMSKMNRIISIDKKNFQAIVEPGVINEEFQNTLKEYKLFYPPDPASKGSCTLGGNFALNAGGPKAVKYGVTSAYVLNLEIVLPNGTIFWTGANTLKNSTGYNLTQLLIGSEGTLAVITKAVLKLIALPSQKILMLVPFQNNLEACDFVAQIMISQISPSALEFMEKEAIDLVQKTQFLDLPFNLESKFSAYLLIELDGENKENLISESEKIYSLLKNYQCGEILFAESAREQERIWKVRRSIGLAVKAFSVYKEEDTVVPRANLAKLLRGVKSIGLKYKFKSICYGHAGDGNLHVNILKNGMSEYSWNHVLKNGIREIFELCVQLGGTISGEHGIGLVQKEYMDIPLSLKNLQIQKDIKKTFDPNNILNPGKIFM